MSKALERNNIFLTDSNMREIADHKIDGFGCISYVDEYFNSKYHFHWHDEFEIAYVLNGKIEFFVNEHTYILNEGDGVFVNSDVLHNYGSALKDIKCIFPNILFDGMMISGADDLLYDKYVKPLLFNSEISYIVFKQGESKSDEFIHDIINAFNLLEDMNWGFEFELRGILTNFIMRLYSYLPDSSKKYNADKPAILSQIVALRKMIAFIKNNSPFQITVQDIADSASLSVRECQRCFKENIRSTPITYLNELRIDQAKSLLSRTTLSISEICEKCGFSGASYFSELFRRKTGLTPVKYRAGKNMSQL